MAKGGGGASGAGRGVRGGGAREQDLSGSLGSSTNPADYRDFSQRPVDAQTWVETNYQPFWDRAWAAQNGTGQALMAYSSMVYQQINAVARGVPANPPLSLDQAVHVRGHIAAIDQALAWSEAQTPESITVYRGMKSDAVYQQIASGHLTAGHELADGGYVSTSPDRRVAEFFADAQPFGPTGKGVLYKILLPKGTPAFSPGPFPPIGVPEELALGRGSRFRVVSSGLQGGRAEATLLYLGANPKEVK